MDVHLPRRAGEEAALLGPHPRARRRRLLPDLGHAVRASRHRSRARLAAPTAHGAGPALPQWPHPALAERRGVDHARGRAPGARRRLRAGRSRSPNSTSCARTRKPPIQVASLAPSLPQLLCRPRLVQRPAAIGTRPTDSERARLAALADEPLPQLVVAPTPVSRQRSAADRADVGRDAHCGCRSGRWQGRRSPQTGGVAQPRATTFVPAPAYDEEHPEELSYRPFPIAPFLTATASVDDPALARMRPSRSRQDAGDAGPGRARSRRCGCDPARKRRSSCGRSNSRARRSTSRASSTSTPGGAGPARQAPGADAGPVGRSGPIADKWAGPAAGAGPAFCRITTADQSGLGLLRSGVGRSPCPGRSPLGDCAARA